MGRSLEERRSFWARVGSLTVDAFAEVCDRCYEIWTLDPVKGEWSWQPLRLNDEQRVLASLVLVGLLSGQPVRIIILKARKLGMSTAVLALGCYLAVFRPGWRSLVVAHQAEATRVIAQIATGIVKRLRPSLRRRMGARPRNGGLEWPNDSSLRVETQRSENAARGGSPSLILATEVGVWHHGRVSSSEESTLISLLGSMELVGGTVVIIESTANGATGAFHSRFRSAEAEPDGVWKALFFPWQHSKKHQPPESDAERALMASLPAGDAGVDALASSPLCVYAGKAWSRVWCERAVEFKLTVPQVQWALSKVAEYGGDLGRFDQEHPLSARLAFLASGRPVFDPELRALWRAAAPAPAGRSGLLRELGPEDHASSWADLATSGDEWEWWAEPVLGWLGRYVIAADIGAGTSSGDFSSIFILDRVTGRQVAQFYSRKHPPEVVGRQLVAVGLLFGGDLIVPEINNHGAVTVRTCLDLGYGALYRRTILANPTAMSWPQEFGWSTDQSTRPQAVNAFAAACRQERVVLLSEAILTECDSFEYNAEGRAAARVGKHDDAVMSGAIAVAVAESLPAAILREKRVPEAWRRRDPIWGGRR